MHHRPARHPLEAAVDHLVAAVEAEEHPREMALWAISTIAHRLGLVAVVASADAGLEAIREIGQDWADLVIEHLRGRPGDHEAALEVIHGVVQRAVDGARRPGPRAAPTILT